jgi:hypothetical protein
MAARKGLKLIPLPPPSSSLPHPLFVRPTYPNIASPPPHPATPPPPQPPSSSSSAVRADPSAVEIEVLKLRRHQLTIDCSRSVTRLAVLLQQQQQRSRPPRRWQLDDDAKEHLQATLKLYLNAFMNVMGCLHVLFVPQRCDLELDPSAVPPPHPVRLALNSTGLCEFQENIDWPYLSPFNSAVLLLNFWTLLCVFTHSFLLHKREAFIIEAFDCDSLLPCDALQLHVVDGCGAADTRWLLQAAGHASFWGGLLSMCGGFRDVLRDGDAAAGKNEAAFVGNLWQQPQFSLQPACAQKPEAVEREQPAAEREQRDADEIRERLAALACANHVCLTWLTLTACSHCLNVLLSAVLVWCAPNSFPQPIIVTLCPTPSHSLLL